MSHHDPQPDHEKPDAPNVKTASEDQDPLDLLTDADFGVDTEDEEETDETPQ